MPDYSTSLLIMAGTTALFGYFLLRGRAFFSGISQIMLAAYLVFLIFPSGQKYDLQTFDFVLTLFYWLPLIVLALIYGGLFDLLSRYLSKKFKEIILIRVITTLLFITILIMYLWIKY